MIYALLANGFEEVEAFAPIDILRRAGLAVKTVGIGGSEICGSHGICVKTDILPEEATEKIDLLFLPGGMPGSSNLDASPDVDALINRAVADGAHIAAICAAPLVLGHRGLLQGKRAVCYPGFEDELIGAFSPAQGARVVTDSNITTAVSMGAACELGLALVEILADRAAADKIQRGAFIPTQPVGVMTYAPALPYEFPNVSLLSDFSTEDQGAEEEVEETLEILNATMSAFGAEAKFVTHTRGARLTRFEFTPNAKTRMRTITNLAEDFGLNLARNGVRVVAPIPEKATIGIEVPNKTPTVVSLKKLLDAPAFLDSDCKTLVCIGEDVTGAPVYCDIAKTPHMLISGATGMGKSVCINSIITSLLYKATPDDVKLILIDPKRVEFAPYRELPHLLTPVITDTRMACAALEWAVGEMERRFTAFSKAGARDLKGYMQLYAKGEATEPFARIVIIIDELHDLMMMEKDSTETSIARITAKARAAGIHLIVGTQRPSVDVITGTIKNNIPTRIAFHVSSQVDSRTILDFVGAEKLLPHGDMLYCHVGAMQPLRVQGAYVSEREIEEVVSFIASRVPQRSTEKVTMEIKRLTEKRLRSFDRVFDAEPTVSAPSAYKPDEDLGSWIRPAMEIGFEFDRLSTSLLQRKLYIGYGKAARLLDALSEKGYVSEPNGAKPREVLITREEFERLCAEFEEEENE